ncbi:MAG: spore germination protein GerW family protein [Myxococcota bacterium]|nr:spore germination protein GerW family protein [Myxococcota bacterium]
MEITQILKVLLSEMRNISSSETVIGEPIQVGDATIVPVNRLGLGFGIAAGDLSAQREKSGENSAGTKAIGGGVSVHPQAFILVDAEGRAQILTLEPGKESALARAIELLPALADRVMERGERMLGRSEEAPSEDEDPETGGD